MVWITWIRMGWQGMTWMGGGVVVGVVVLGLVKGGIGAEDRSLPPLAWSSWNYFGNTVNETIVRETADAMVALGLVDLGYEFVNVDAGYLEPQRDSSGNLVVNAKFPSGMKALSEYLGARGLKLGLYTDVSNHSCGYGPGSAGYYEKDAKQFAAWGAGWLKVDFCLGKAVPVNPVDQLKAWEAFGMALNSTGVPIYYYICPHSVPPDVGPGSEYQGGLAYAPPLAWDEGVRNGLANSLLVEFLNTLDYWYTPHAYGGKFPGGIISNIDSTMLTNLSWSGRNHWHDFDMLTVCMYGEGELEGNGMTLEEYRSHYSVWVVLGGALVQGANFITLNATHPDCLDLLLNPEILAVNQDPLLQPPRLILQHTNASTTRVETIITQVFARTLYDGSVAVVVLNRAEFPQTISVSLQSLHLAQNVSLRDLWARKDIGSATNSIQFLVQPHAVKFIKATSMP